MKKELTKIKNVIHCLKVGADLVACEDCDLYPCDHTDVEDLARVAINAIEKQIPKNPIVGVQSFLKCACCHSVVRITDNYCHECGQMLDWTD